MTEDPDGALPAPIFLGNPLAVDDDEYEEVTGDSLVRLHSYDALDDARAAALALVEHGMGASVVAVEVGSPSAAPYELRVLPGELGRAAEVLGLSVPAAPGPEHQGRLPVAWRQVLVIWLIALIVLPVVAGVATYVISTR
jgi:hypothetical protein